MINFSPELLKFFEWQAQQGSAEEAAAKLANLPQPTLTQAAAAVPQQENVSGSFMKDVQAGVYSPEELEYFQGLNSDPVGQAQAAAPSGPTLAEIDRMTPKEFSDANPYKNKNGRGNWLAGRDWEKRQLREAALDPNSGLGMLTAAVRQGEQNLIDMFGTSFQIGTGEGRAFQLSGQGSYQDYKEQYDKERAKVLEVVEALGLQNKKDGAYLSLGDFTRRGAVGGDNIGAYGATKKGSGGLFGGIRDAAADVLSNPVGQIVAGLATGGVGPALGLTGLTSTAAGAAVNAAAQQAVAGEFDAGDFAQSVGTSVLGQGLTNLGNEYLNPNISTTVLGDSPLDVFAGTTQTPISDSMFGLGDLANLGTSFGPGGPTQQQETPNIDKVLQGARTGRDLWEVLNPQVLGNTGVMVPGGPMPDVQPSQGNGWQDWTRVVLPGGFMPSWGTSVTDIKTKVQDATDYVGKVISGEVDLKDIPGDIYDNVKGSVTKVYENAKDVVGSIVGGAGAVWAAIEEMADGPEKKAALQVAEETYGPPPISSTEETVTEQELIKGAEIGDNIETPLEEETTPVTTVDPDVPFTDIPITNIVEDEQSTTTTDPTLAATTTGGGGGGGGGYTKEDEEEMFRLASILKIEGVPENVAVAAMTRLKGLLVAREQSRVEGDATAILDPETGRYIKRYRGDDERDVRRQMQPDPIQQALDEVIAA